MLKLLIFHALLAALLLLAITMCWVLEPSDSEDPLHFALFLGVAFLFVCVVISGVVFLM